MALNSHAAELGEWVPAAVVSVTKVHLLHVLKQVKDTHLK